MSYYGFKVHPHGRYLDSKGVTGFVHRFPTREDRAAWLRYYDGEEEFNPDFPRRACSPEEIFTYRAGKDQQLTTSHCNDIPVENP